MSQDSLAGKTASIVARALSEGLFAGVVLRVERGGALLLETAFGNALDSGSVKTPMTMATSFDIASLTKLFTTTAILRLATMGRLDLDVALCDIKAMSRLARGRPEIEKAFRAITVKKLLTHSSGLHYWYPFYAEKDADFPAILERVLRRFPLQNGCVYSDLNFMLLGRIAESAADRPLAEAMENIVCGPLGLGDSGYFPTSGPFAATEFGNRIEMKMVEDLGLSFGGWRDTEKPIVGEPDDGNCHYYFGGAAGHAGVFSNAADLCALGRLYLDPAGKGGYLEPALVAEAASDHGGNRGLGFQLGELYPGGGFGHTGFTGTYLYLNRCLDLAVAIFTNRLHVENPRNINEFRKEIVNAAIGRLAALSKKTG
jgi:serine-type D-Ala-D-Ala carboxypeptidase